MALINDQPPIGPIPGVPDPAPTLPDVPGPDIGVPVTSPNPIASPPPDAAITETDPSTESTDTSAPPPEPKYTAVVRFPYTRPTKIDPDQITIYLPANFDPITRERFANLPNVNLGTDSRTRDWIEVTNGGLSHTMLKDVYSNPDLKDGTYFEQGVEHQGEWLMGVEPKVEHIENSRLGGERAVIRLQNALGLGSPFYTPLWHTGIWISFKTPTESEIVELNRQIISDKVELGRHSYGLIFSNTVVYTVERLVDFAINHIYQTSIQVGDGRDGKQLNTDHLKKIIPVQDIPSLIWGLVRTMYPRGFQYQRACIENPEKCNYVSEELLNISKLLYDNPSLLNEWQKAHMAQRQTKSKSLESIEHYQSSLIAIQPKKITFNDHLSMTLKTPTIFEYINSGHQWISSIVSFVEKTIGADHTTNELNNLITAHAQASIMRNYEQWVQSIELDTNVIDDRETLNQALDVLSADDTIRDTFVESVIDYINHSTIALVGIPVFECPVCHATTTGAKDVPYFTNIIPLDVLQVFFELLNQRLMRITER